MKLFLIDGHALIFKMYYAFLGRPMMNSRGEDTSILFGFTKYLLELVEKEHPTHLAVGFDPPGGCFRNKLYPEYKANRGETPALVIDALEPLRKIVSALDIPVLMIPGFEADDVLGSVAKRFAAEDMDVYLVTPDKDYAQLVDRHIFQYRPEKGGEHTLLDEKGVCEKYGISSCSQVVDLLAICGDSADNVPGVKGVGGVGAAKLLSRFENVEEIYGNLDKLTPRQKELFEEASDHIALSKTLVTIKTDVQVSLTRDDMALRVALNPEVEALFLRYEFPSLKKYLKPLEHPVPGKEASSPGEAVLPVVESVPCAELEKLARKVGAVGLEYEDGRLCVACGGKGCCGEIRDFSGILGDSSISKAGSDLKSIVNAAASASVPFLGRLYDVSLMHYLLNPESSHKIETLAMGYLGIDVTSGESSSDSAPSLFGEEAVESESPFCLFAALSLSLSEKLKKALEDASLYELYDSMEQPLIYVLSGMERRGVRIDPSVLDEFARDLRRKVGEKEALVRSLASEPDLNVSSPKQVGEVLFGKMKIDPGMKKPRNGNYPTDEQTLSALREGNPIIDAILDFRGYKKLLSTYIEPLPANISPLDGRVHTTFNQALTSTGRLSSSNPNLQNIPIRTDDGREIRRAFVSGNPESFLMSADYSQIELRIMAHLCGDEHLRQAFSDEIDVHSLTASKIFKVNMQDVTASQRRVAKTANFGIMYGISSFGLAQRLGCSRSEASALIKDYFESFPSIREYIDKTVEEGRRKGWVQTIFGRRRYLPDLSSHNANLRALAERNAVNAPIQGSAADIIKLAMVAVDRALPSAAPSSGMVLQIHDELLLEVPSAELDTVKALLTDTMEGIVKLSVPLKVECNYGKSWLEAH